MRSKLLDLYSDYLISGLSQEGEKSDIKAQTMFMKEV